MEYLCYLCRYIFYEGIENIEQYLEKNPNIDVNEYNEENLNPLCYLVMRVNDIELLIRNKYDSEEQMVEYVKCARSLLHKLSEAIRTLYKYGADPNFPNKKGESPYYRFMINGKRTLYNQKIHNARKEIRNNIEMVLNEKLCSLEYVKHLYFQEPLK